LIRRKVVAAEIGNGELAKDVVEDRGRVFDLFVSLDRAGSSNRMAVNASTNPSSGTPCCRPSGTAIAKLFIQRPEGRALLVHVDENLAEATIGIISCSEVDLLTADARLLGVAVAPVGEALALRKLGDRRGGRPLPVPSLIFAGVGLLGK
jgi:hypothetical protein